MASAPFGTTGDLTIRQRHADADAYPRRMNETHLPGRHAAQMRANSSAGRSRERIAGRFITNRNA
jgi:hypothetical protein